MEERNKVEGDCLDRSSAATEIEMVLQEHIDKLEAENRTLEVENKLINPLRNFIRSKHLSSEWGEFLNDYILNKK